MAVRSPSELGRSPASIKGDELAAPITVAAMTGLRRREVVALRWEDIDSDAEQVAVRRNLTTAANRPVEGKPKTGVHPGRRVAMASRPGVSGVRSAREGIGLPRIRFHDLPHSHCTHLLAAGANPRVVADRLGHASVAFTLQSYGHVLPGQQAGAAAAVAGLVWA